LVVFLVTKRQLFPSPSKAGSSSLYIYQVNIQGILEILFSVGDELGSTRKTSQQIGSNLLFGLSYFFKIKSPKLSFDPGLF